MLRWSVVYLALFVYVQGRAVNISNTWVLPEEGFPVFYRYFRDRISWYEADAVCQFHHANLVTVDTTAQYDAVRAYLKELDITSAVWVGLIRSNPDGDFTWTDYRGLSGEGYWSSAPDARTAPLCAAANPSADYRWEARACGGPTVASFICELPVPQWALGKEGCMVRALPALTILYLPESAAVQLTADCGLAGVKRVQCTGNVKREDLLKELSCAQEEEVSSTPVMAGLTTTWAATTDLFTDEDTTKEITIDDNITTEHEDDINQPTIGSSTPVPEVINLNQNPKPSFLNTHRINDIIISKNVDMDSTHDNNLQSNVIPEIPNKVNSMDIEHLEKLVDERNLQHKIIHEEIARIGNLDKIFTQPTDHFVPPLVMAKAKLSDDMTVLSLAEKHAQQLAEQQFMKHKLRNRYDDNVSNINEKSTVKPPSKTVEVISKYDKKKFDEKKEILKNIVPKKYSEKLNDPKGKLLKSPEIKLYDFQKTTERVQPPTEMTVKDQYAITSTANTVTQDTVIDIDDDHIMDLSVFLKDEPMDINKPIIATNYSGDISNLEALKEVVVKNNTQTSNDIDNVKEENVSFIPISNDPTQDASTTENVILNHNVVKMTILQENISTKNPTVLDITTMTPPFLDVSNNSTSLDNTNLNNSDIIGLHEIAHNITTSNIVLTTTSQPQTETTIVNTKITSTELPSTVTIEITTKTLTSDNNSPTTTASAISSSTISSSTTTIETSTKELDLHNDFHEEPDMNSTETEIDDFQSPLLSAANEPIHRPNRSRRPQQQNRIKFNPFRILG